jgi:hypothetical protein
MKKCRMGRHQSDSGKIDSKEEGELHGHGERNETGWELPGHGVEWQFGNQGALEGAKNAVYILLMCLETRVKREIF